MIVTIEAEFGDIKISQTKVRVYSSPTEENEFYVHLWDGDQLSKKTDIPKGSLKLKFWLKSPPDCPHCHKQLPDSIAWHYELKEIETYEYKGVTIKRILPIEGYDDDVVELLFHYETVEYKSCYQNDLNLIKS